jgi:hypothetical protein
VEPHVATILTFSMSGDARRAEPRPDMRAEVIVFPRTDLRALHRLSDAASERAPVGEPPAGTPGDGTA